MHRILHIDIYGNFHSYEKHFIEKRVWIEKNRKKVTWFPKE